MHDFEAEVILGRVDQATLAFGSPMFDPGHDVDIPVLLHAPGSDGRPQVSLDVRTTIELRGWGRWVQGLLAFADDLGASWQGWNGAKTWQDDEENVALSATHDGHGTVAIEVEIRHGAPETWSTRALVMCDAYGLSGFAEGIGRMLRAAPWPFDYPLRRP